VCKCMFVCAHECVRVCVCVCVCVCVRERKRERARVWKNDQEIEMEWGEVGGLGGRERLSVCLSVCERESVCVYVRE